MGQIGVGIVGCGRISDLHALGYKDFEDARIVAVCDNKVKSANQKASQWGVGRVYQDYQDLLADSHVQLVELLTPHHLHAEMAIAACKAGKHVSVQKPMALNVLESNRMILAADQAGVLLRIYENFIFYPPFVRAKEMIDAGEIGDPQMIRVHYNSGNLQNGWKVPIRAWLWRFNQKQSGGGPIIFDHGYHLFSITRYLMGEVEKVYAWIDKSPILPTLNADAPATIMVQFKSPRRYGVMDFSYTPKMQINTRYYADDNRVEVIGEKGILLINRCTARTIDLPALILFRDGVNSPIELGRVEWQDSFIDCTHHLINAIKTGKEPILDGLTGKAVLQFSLAAHLSSRFKREVHPDEVR